MASENTPTHTNTPPPHTHTHAHAYASYSSNAHRSPSWKGRCVKVHLISCTVHVHIDTSDYSRHTHTFAQAPCMLIYSKHHTVPPGVYRNISVHLSVSAEAK